MFANAAEIMRWEGGWIESGAKWQGGSGFSIQLYWLFARQSVINGQANYGMVSIKSLLSFAVYLDDITMVCKPPESPPMKRWKELWAHEGLPAYQLHSIITLCTSCTTICAQVFMATTTQLLLSL